MKQLSGGCETNGMTTISLENRSEDWKKQVKYAPGRPPARNERRRNERRR